MHASVAFLLPLVTVANGMRVPVGRRAAVSGAAAATAAALGNPAFANDAGAAKIASGYVEVPKAEVLSAGLESYAVHIHINGYCWSLLLTVAADGSRRP